MNAGMSKVIVFVASGGKGNVERESVQVAFPARI